MVTPLDIARRELAAGVKEATGKNDGVPSERYAEGRREPWCADFVRYCFETSGTKLPGVRAMQPSVAYLEAELERAGARVTAPEAGAIVTFRWRQGSDAGSGRHVGIVEAVSPTQVTTIEGNSGDAVARRTYRRDHPALAGFFVWPRRAS